MHFRPLKKYRKDSGGGQKCNALTLFLKHVSYLSTFLSFLCALLTVTRAMSSLWMERRYKSTTSELILLLSPT